MDFEQKIKQLEEDFRHEYALRELQGNRLDTHDIHLTVVNATLDRIATQLSLVADRQTKITEQQFKTEKMLQDLIEALTKPGGNGKH